MKIKKEDIEVKMEAPDTVLRSQTGFGGMAVAFNELPAGTDFTPLLKGLANDSCHCPHWGYILEGALKIIYDDGKEERIQAGEVFYFPPGHTGMVEENVKFVEFSPEKEFLEVMDHLGKMMS